MSTNIWLDHESEEVKSFDESHLNFTVSKRPMQYVVDDAWRESTQFTIARDDTHQALGVVGDGYIPIQNREAWDSIVEPLNNLGYDFVVKSANTIDNGKMMFMQIHLNDAHFTVNNNGEQDKFESYLTVWNSHDGNMALTVGDTKVRIWCYNTFMDALRSAGCLFKHSIAHSGNVSMKIEGMKIATELKLERDIQTQADLQKLAGMELRRQEAKEFAYGFLQSASARSSNQAESIFKFFNKGIKCYGNTRYDMVNAVTQFYTHGDDSKDTHWKNIAEERGCADRQIDRRNAQFKSSEYVHGVGAKRKANVIDTLLNEKAFVKTVQNGKAISKTVRERKREQARK